MSEQLKDIIDQAENVQERLSKMNNQIRDLDVAVDQMIKEVKEKSLIFCKNQRHLSRDAKMKAVKEIKTLHSGIVEKSNKKEKIANDMYEFIDKKIQKLDDNMRIFNNEMKEKTLKEATRIKGGLKSGRGDKKKKGEDKKARLQDESLFMYKPLQLEAMDMPVNPNEPRYCTCHQVSFGEMIACDNPGCQYEWFHYQCIGITEAPPGEFICKYCKAAKAEKKKK